MTEDTIIDGVFAKEGDTYGDRDSHPPIDQPTARGGITLKTLRAFVRATGSALPITVETLKAMTHAQAREIVRWEIREVAREQRLDQVVDEPLRLQLLDFGYNSGPALAMRWLQRVLRVERSGVLDAPTVAALAAADAWLVHHAFMGARLQMIDMWSDPDPARPRDANVLRKGLEEGLENRALLFSRLPIP